jgi:hypothetical protein
VQKMIKNGLVPDIEHPVTLQRPFQSMGAECAETDARNKERLRSEKREAITCRSSRFLRSLPHLPPKNLRND